MNKATSGKQLASLLKKLHVNNFDVIRKKDINKSNADNLIINLDDNGDGSHWVAMNRNHKLYFDSYGRPPPNEVPHDYKYKTKIIEGIEQQDCGQLSALWLHYVNHSTPDEFYKLFKSLY